MSHMRIRKDGWNTAAAVLGPFWYLSKGINAKGLMLFLVDLFTLGLGIIPVAIYCGFKGNQDFYRFLKYKGHYIYCK